MVVVNARLAVFAILLSALVLAAGCEGFYDIFSVEFSSFTTLKSEYSAGDAVSFAGAFKGKFNAPLPDVGVKLKVLYRENESLPAYGEETVDEFYLEKTYNIRPGESAQLSGTWKIPAGARPGYYRIVPFVYSGPYQMSGASFVSGVYLSSAVFKVHGRGGAPVLDASRIYVSGKQYNPAVSIGIERDAGEDLNITVPLLNKGAAGKVKMTYRVYSWDEPKHIWLKEKGANGELTQGPLLDSLSAANSLWREEAFTMAAGEEKELNYVIGKLPPGAYSAVIIAEKDGAKSEVIVRVPIRGMKADFAYVGSSIFPLKKGTSGNISACFSLTGGSGPGGLFPGLEAVSPSQTAPLTISIIGDGKTITSRQFNVVLGYSPTGTEFSFELPENANELTIRAELMDADGKLIDIGESKYSQQLLVSKPKLSLAASGAEEKASYVISCADEFGEPFVEVVSVSFVSSGSSVAYSAAENVSGTLAKTIPLQPGNYTIYATDSFGNLAVSSIEVAGKQAQSQPTGQKPPTMIEDIFSKQGMTLAIISILIFVMILVLAKSFAESKDKRRRKV